MSTVSPQGYACNLKCGYDDGKQVYRHKSFAFDIFVIDVLTRNKYNSLLNWNADFKVTKLQNIQRMKSGTQHKMGINIDSHLVYCSPLHHVQYPLMFHLINRILQPDDYLSWKVHVLLTHTVQLELQTEASSN